MLPDTVADGTSTSNLVVSAVMTTSVPILASWFIGVALPVPATLDDKNRSNVPGTTRASNAPRLPKAMVTLSPAALRRNKLTTSPAARTAPLIVMVPATIVCGTSASSVVVPPGRMTTPSRSRANWLTGAIAVAPVAEKNTS